MKAGVILLAGMLACAAPAQAKNPVIVELYTSQGCGACVEANRLVDELVGREDLLPLTFSVDYWDYLGWEDTFAKPEFSERQRSYAQRWDRPAVFTPQVIIAGRGQTVAGETETIERLIDEAGAGAFPAPDVKLLEDRVSVGRGAGRAAEVWLIRYDPRGQDVIVRRGENQGRTLTYRNVVRELVRLGDWTGQPQDFDLPETELEGLSTVILVQETGGGAILALQGI